MRYEAPESLDTRGSLACGRPGRRPRARRGHRSARPDARRRPGPRADRRHQEDPRDPRGGPGKGRLAHRRRGDGGGAQGERRAPGQPGPGWSRPPTSSGRPRSRAGRPWAATYAMARRRRTACPRSSRRGRSPRWPGRRAGATSRSRTSCSARGSSRSPRASSSCPSFCPRAPRARATPTCASSRARRWTSPWWASGVNLTVDGKGVITAARVSLGAVAAKVLLVPAAAQAIVGSTPRPAGAGSARGGGARGVPAHRRQARHRGVPDPGRGRAHAPRGPDRHRAGEGELN